MITKLLAVVHCWRQQEKKTISKQYKKGHSLVILTGASDPLLLLRQVQSPSLPPRDWMCTRHLGRLLLLLPLAPLLPLWPRTFRGIIAVDADAFVVACDALAVAFAVEDEAFALDARAG